MIIITNILDALIVAVIGLLLNKMIKWKCIFPLLIIWVFGLSPYNLLCMALLLLIIYLINKDKYNDLLVAFLIGLIVITKQNIGICLFIPMIIYSKKKIKSILVFLIPIFILIIYLLTQHALFNFIDYTFLGLFEFSENKSALSLFFIIEIVIIIYLIYKFWKSKFKDKELFYIIMFQFVTLPICELRHFMTAFTIFLFYFLKTCHNKKIWIPLCIIECLFLVNTYYYNFNYIEINKKKDMLYLKNSSSLVNFLEDVYKYFDGNINNVYFDSENSYLLKLYYNAPINEFDFYIHGNMGHYNNKRIKKELVNHCKKEQCSFLIYKKQKKNSQWYELNNFVKNNYKKTGTFKEFEVYSSK